MQDRHVGKSGLRVSAVGLGCNNFGWRIEVDEARRVVHRAIDLGVTLFDTADVYGSSWGRAEEVLGEVIHGQRDKIVLVSKFGRSQAGGAVDNSRSYALKAIEASLKRLRTDWIDVYMVHFPDAATPTDETLRALDDIVSSGKARYIACSNFAAWRVVEAKWVSRELRAHSFICAQNEYSLLARRVEQDLIPALNACDMGLMPYLPLAGGMLTGKYLNEGAQGRLADNFLNLGSRFLSERNKEIVRGLDGFARERGHTILELAVSWLVAQPLVCGVIAGATMPEQVDENIRAADWSLTSEEFGQVDRLTKT
jgi:aryl-alcohol dehydrogenase-like predicted oxidoreductase